MDKLEKFVKLVIEAIAKARVLQGFDLDPESKGKVAGLMDRVQKTQKTIDSLGQVVASNGQGLDKAMLDGTLDRLIETMEMVNRELDRLLALAKGE
jgi:hypothetical protein